MYEREWLEIHQFLFWSNIHPKPKACVYLYLMKSEGVFFDVEMFVIITFVNDQQRLRLISLSENISNECGHWTWTTVSFDFGN